VAYSAVVLDLDGTLLNSDKQVSDRNYKSILRCYERGLKIIFATARPPRAVNWFLPQELIQMGSFVYYNGALIACKRSGIHLHEPIYSDTSNEVISYCIQENPNIDLSIEVQDEWYSLKEMDYSIIVSVKGNPIVKSMDELATYDATKILMTGSLDIQKLKIRFDSILNIIVTDQGSLIQIMSKQASKELAVSKLIDAYHLKMEDVIAFGDDHNDVGLFRSCGHSVAMGNAVVELKDIASEITATHDDDGVAVILERILSESY
jgi:Cof subfamily protein (haloacid dehalogenase superfamily)